MTQLKQIFLSGALLKRGFWLYAWKITAENKQTYYYVGMTGDMSSLNAQSPVSRISGHLGSNKRANALRRHLEKAGIVIDRCEELNFFAYGPLYEETKDKKTHIERRDKVRALEKALCDAMCDLGYNVLNRVNCSLTVESMQWAEIRGAFSDHFDLLMKRA